MAEEALRLRAARLAAGYVVGKDAALAMGIPLQTFRSAENGTTPIGKALLRAVVSHLGVTETFMKRGKTETDRDRLAARLAKIIEVAEQDADSPNQGVLALRLKSMRIEAGHETPTAAARAMGWAVPTYSAHEGTQNAIGVERQIGYALAYGYRPEFAVLGKFPKRPTKAAEQVDWKDLRAVDEVVAAPSVQDWQWLRARESGIPVVTLSRQRISILPQRLSLPSPAIASKLGGRSGHAHFAFQPVDEPLSYYIVDPLAGDGALVLCEPSGAARVIGAPQNGATPEDPVRNTAVKEPVPLGRLVVKVALRLESD
jgi:hypothetical protein